MINFRFISNIFSKLLIAEIGFLFVCLLTSLYYRDNGSYAFIFTIAITIAMSAILWLLGRGYNKDISKKDGYIIVSLTWVVFSIIGCLPYLFTHSATGITDAFFETMSGFTTTGASILNNIESLPKSLLLWRSLTQWIGGMGIIVLFLAILPKLGVGGRELYLAETTGPVGDKIKPRLRSTAQKLWIIYIALTLIETICLYFAGMSWFDAINHSFTTMASGGYSTKNNSIAYFNSPLIEYIIIVFMIFSGINFSLLYLTAIGNIKSVIKDEELKLYLAIIFCFTAVIAFELYRVNSDIESDIRNALFNVTTLITSTGFTTTDYMKFPAHIPTLLFMLLFIGGSGGSTSGGVKVIRVLILVKNSYCEMVRLINPNAIVPVRYNNKPIKPETVSSIIAFVILYTLTFAAAVMTITIWVPDLETVMSAVATCMANAGPGMGQVGPAFNFSAIPDPAKWILSTVMLLGRLELFTVMVLFTKAFWKK